MHIFVVEKGLGEGDILENLYVLTIRNSCFTDKTMMISCYKRCSSYDTYAVKEVKENIYFKRFITKVNISNSIGVFLTAIWIVALIVSLVLISDN